MVLRVWMLDGVFFAKFSLAWIYFFSVRKGLSLATLAHSPDRRRNLEIVVTWRKQPVLARKSCSYFNVSVSLLTAFLSSFLFVFSSNLEGRPVLVPYFLHLFMTVFTVFRGISNTLEIALCPEWYLWTLWCHWCFVRSLWPVALAVGCHQEKSYQKSCGLFGLNHSVISDVDRCVLTTFFRWTGWIWSLIKGCAL